MSFIDNSRHVFIVFENAQSAQTAVAIPTHRINQKLVNVYLNERHSEFINIDLSLVPEQHESPKHLLNSLPDECLLGIFEYIDVKDLANVADTCTKFRSVAKDIFANEFSSMSYEPSIDEMDARTLARVLRNFGACMESFVLIIWNHLLSTAIKCYTGLEDVIWNCSVGIVQFQKDHFAN